MARSNSVINVDIIGDARKLIGALGAADTASGGLLKSAAKMLVAGQAVRKGFGFIQDALGEADRLGDAMGRLTNQLGAGTAEALADTADEFTRIGASTQDILELEAIFADFATTAKIADPSIRGMAESVAATAQALTQTDDQGRDASAMMDLLTKAAGGSEKAARELGVTLVKGADAGDQMRLILSQLEAKLKDASTGTLDLQGRQDQLGAKFEIVMGKIGAGVAGPLTDVLTFINDEIDAIPGAIKGWQMLGAATVNAAEDMLGPLARVADALRTIIDLLPKALVDAPNRSGHRSDRDTSRAVQREQEANGLHAGMGGP